MSEFERQLTCSGSQISAIEHIAIVHQPLVDVVRPGARKIVN